MRLLVRKLALIYLWASVARWTLLGALPNLFSTSLIDFVYNVYAGLLLVGLYGLVYKKRMFIRGFWQAFVLAQTAHRVYLTVSRTAADSFFLPSTEQLLSSWLFWVVYWPALVGAFWYAFFAPSIWRKIA